MLLQAGDTAPMRLTANLFAFTCVFLLGVLGGFTYVSNMIGSQSLDASLFLPSRLAGAASMLCLVVSMLLRSRAKSEA